jgi:PAP2 superfamily
MVVRVDAALLGISGRVSTVRSLVWRRGVLEALAIVALYLVSELSRGLAGGGEADAERHAADVVAAERHLHVFVESTVQSAARHVAALPTLLGYAYLSLHLLGTAAVLVWVYRRHRHVYARLRNTLVLANAIAVAGYALFPTAPPRLAGVGISDTVSGATSVNLTSRFVSSFYNPYAAVPSMHIGFSLLIGITVWRLARRRAVRAAGLAYPLFVLFVIVATGNHFFLDAAAGAAVAVVAAVVTAAPAWRRRSSPAVVHSFPLPTVTELQERRAA